MESFAFVFTREVGSDGRDALGTVTKLSEGRDHDAGEDWASCAKIAGYSDS